VVVGDVAGSGLAGAIVMGRMRSALRSYALEFPDPAEVLRKLDRKMQYFEGEVMATVSYAVLDPASGQLQVSSAGHFPPVIAVAGRPGVLAEIAVDAPIGVADAARRQVTTLDLTSGAVLCFFTDGLVERRDEPVDDGIARLCAAVMPGPPEKVCISVMGAMVGSEQPGDDIALLALRWQRQTPSAAAEPGQAAWNERLASPMA
jgi:phosphoserine phosphatase RsbU/P